MAKKKELTPEIPERIEIGTLDTLMGDKFALYAKDVIQDRAIPDARDGLKPVQRRIVYDMWKTGNTIDKPHKKCAHIVGDVMGKYHPHGDSSIYEALVHLSQTWAIRYPLIDFQGNNGSIDGDGPAAFRYTEARLSALSNELVADIDKDTVDMELTFDDSLLEPSVLPARFPNLLVNGSEGIAVGVATSIPPHNLKEVSQAIIHRMRHPNCAVEDLMAYVPGPDFPTGGYITDSEALKDIYRTGRGKVTVSGKAEIVVSPKGDKQIIITEIPYRVNKSVLVKAIDKIRHDKTIPGIDEVRDETDKEGLRIAVDLKSDAKPEAVLAYLMAKTPLRTSYSAHIMAIVDDRPKTLSLLSYCDAYIQHQLEVVTRRSRFLKDRAEKRLEIVNGLIRCLDILDEIVHLIRQSENRLSAKEALMDRFSFTEPQADAILQMPLYKLSHTDVGVLLKEKADLDASLKELGLLLSDQNARENLIAEDLRRIYRAYSGERKTKILDAAPEVTIDKRDLIAKEPCYVIATRDGYLKRSSLKSYRGSGGQNGARPGIKSGDAFVLESLAETTDYVLLFTNLGNYLYIPVNEIKETRWNEEGHHVNMLVPIAPEERIVAAFAVRRFRSDLNVILLTKWGSIKRIQLSLFPVTRRSKPVSAIRLQKGDALIDATISSGNSLLLILGQEGSAALYNENEVWLSNPRTGGMKACSFGQRGLASVLSFSPDEGLNAKILLLTDRAATRVALLKNVPVGHRLDRATYIFQSFKKEPHRLVAALKAQGLETPFSLDAVTDDKSRVDVSWDDFLVTQEQNAKRPASFPAKARIVSYSRLATPPIDDSIKAFAPPEPPEKEEPAKEAEQSPFEQISLFDDLLDDDKDA